MNGRNAMIVGVIALLLGAAGLVVGLNAKSENQSDEEVADQVKTELEERIGGTAKTAEGARQQDIAQGKQIKATQARQADLVATVNKLRTEVNDLTAQVNKQGGELTQLSNQLTQLQKTVENLQRRVNNNL
jgi:chromosome segregation ATPase